MKNLLYIHAAAIFLFVLSCNSNNQNNAEKKADEISNITTQSSDAEKPNPDGSYLKATINGKEWKASKTGPGYGPDSDYKLIAGEAKDITINFRLHKPFAGMKKQFGVDYEANLITDDGFFSGKKGEVFVTSADEKWIEGTFYFTATSSNSDKMYEITNGSFRISIN